MKQWKVLARFKNKTTLEELGELCLMTTEDRMQAQSLLKRRINGEPLPWLTGVATALAVQNECEVHINFVAQLNDA